VHFDHFNPKTLEWCKRVPDIKYVFSKDISDAGVKVGENVFFLDKSETYQDENLVIKAFGSTDVGISFLIEWNGKTIFHAGDLNNWHWSEESTEKEVELADRAFSMELSALKREYAAIDVVFFPVDPRQGKDYTKGAEQFLERINVKHFVPMHFVPAYDKALAFKPYVERKEVDFIIFRHSGDSIHLK
jgi:L-ascorbate metabolism protein UlaG (beta-lactamase superfamily)